MKKCFLPLTAAILGFILAACASVEYRGESLPPLSSDTPVKFYLASELDKMPGVIVLGTAEYTARSSLTSKDIREKLQTAARREGANGIRVVFMEKIPDGEARKDQINNTSAPQWNDQLFRRPRQGKDHLQDVRESRIPVRARNRTEC